MERLGREKFHGWNCQAHQNYKSRVKFDRDWYDINSLTELSLIEVRLIDERFTKYENDRDDGGSGGEGCEVAPNNSNPVR